MTVKTAVNDGTTEKEYIDERAAAAFENTYDAGGNTNITVTVTDDRHGSLSVDIDYAEDAGGIEFVNAYGAGTEAELNLKGNKEIIPGEGLTNAPTLADDTFTFEITGNAADDGTPAPMPENTAAVNKSGAVSFGPITFTMENVFGTSPEAADVTAEEQTAEDAAADAEEIDVQTAGRTKTFTYR